MVLVPNSEGLREHGEPGDPDYPHGNGRARGDDAKNGTMLLVSRGKGFSQQQLVVLKTEKGWRRIHDFRVQEDGEPHGVVGDVLDITGTTVMQTFQSGIGDTISNVFEIAALPSGSRLLVTSKQAPVEKVYEKRGEQWITPDGKAVEYFHFNPKVFRIRVKA